MGKLQEGIKKEMLKNGEELVLRHATKEDASEVIKYLNIVGGESDNLLFGENEFPLTVEQEEKYLEGVMEDDNQLMILGIIAGKVVSVAGLHGSNRARIVHNRDLGISVKKEYWEQGIATIVIKSIIKFARENPKIKTISLGVKEDNIVAIKLYEKVGFEIVGRHKNFFNIDGEFYDEILMDIYL